MAQIFARGAVPGVALLLLMITAGCQSGNSPQMREHAELQVSESSALPSPPQANAPQKARPRPQPPLVQREPVQPPAPSIAGVPRGWIPPVPARKWEWIIIHHSATAVGGAARFNREHQAKGWDELGYDFVIGNGTDTANGLVEVGPRWVKQKTGAHTKTPDNMFNEKGVGICLVGNFDTARPTTAQLQSMAKLVAYLMKTYRIPADHIIGHGDAKATDCPGKNLHIALVRNMSIQVLAAAGQTPPPSRVAVAKPGEEMLVTAKHAAVR